MHKNSSKIVIVATVICIAAYIGVFIGRVSVESPFENDLTTAADRNSTQNRFAIDLNTADYDSLMELPGMNAELADEIIAYRHTFGSYIAIKELLNLDNMTSQIYDQIKTYIHIGGAS